MKAVYVLQFEEGRALERLQAFLSGLWESAGLQAILAPVDFDGGEGPSPAVISRRAGLADVNPFAPLMQSNSAAMVEELKRDYPEGRVGVLMRPCELRTLAELNRRQNMDPEVNSNGRQGDRLFAIGIDCAGTYSTADYHQQVSRNGLPAILEDTLAAGCVPGASPVRLRMACQLCSCPTSDIPDVSIGYLGSAPYQFFLVAARDEAAAASYRLEELCDGQASKQSVLRREDALNSITQERLVLRSQLMANPALRVGDLTGLMACLSRCTLCADCLDACPLYDGELSGMLGVGSHPLRQRPLLSELIDVSRWLASCTVCGMCQEACTNGVPLIPMIATLSHRIRAELVLQDTAMQPVLMEDWDGFRRD